MATSPIRLLVGAATLAIVLAGVLAVPATADQIYATGPGCGQFLCFGFDVSTTQAVGVRFTPGSDYNLDELGFWFMNNDFSGQIFGQVDVTVEGNLDVDGCSTPDGMVIDTASFAITAVGFEPEFDSTPSTEQPFLTAGETYWVVARSDSVPGQNPVWVASDGFTGFSAVTEFGDLNTWQCGGTGAVSGIALDGTRAGSDYQITVDNLVAGASATVTLSGALPNQTTYLAFSTTGLGETFVSALNVTVELANPFTRVAPIATDANGDGTWTLPIPGGASGRTVWIQSAQNDKRSNVVEATVQ